MTEPDSQGLDEFGAPAMSFEYLREQAFLVSRGVRPMALAGTAPNCNPVCLKRLNFKLDEAQRGTGQVFAIPFIATRSDGEVDFGYAASAWVVDLYRWVVSQPDLPERQYHRLVGLLLGYAPHLIQDHEDRNAGLFLDEVSYELPESGAK